MPPSEPDPGPWATPLHYPLAQGRRRAGDLSAAVSLSALMAIGIEHKHPRQNEALEGTLVGRFDNVGRDRLDGTVAAQAG